MDYMTLKEASEKKGAFRPVKSTITALRAVSLAL